MRRSLLIWLLFAAFSARAQVWDLSSAVATSATASTAMQTSKMPQGQIESTTAVVDPVFQIHEKALGLERGVEMLQWRQADLPAPAHYESAWTAEHIDSSGFDAAHKNTGDLPFNGERWWTTDPKLDGRPVSPDVLAALDAWTPLKPDLSQLPTNLAVSFQPDGAWLSTSQDPAHPAIGDVRVHWRVIEHAAAPIGAVLIAGRWELRETATASAPTAAVASPTTSLPGNPTQAWLQRILGDHFNAIAIAGIVFALLLLLWKRRR